jgi:hypothetical protein
MAVDLLSGDGAAARDILTSWKPRMTRQQYLDFQRSVARTEVYDGRS